MEMQKKRVLNQSESNIYKSSKNPYSAALALKKSGSCFKKWTITNASV